jgi:3',5'-cyclic AMP phosphodiesterase CpdA
MTEEKNKKNSKEKGFISKIVYWLLFTVFVYFGVNALSYADTLNFAHLSDLHYSDQTMNIGYRMLGESKELLADEIAQVNAGQNLDFVIITGDLIDRPKESLLEEIISELNKLKYPWYAALGNHDVAIGGNLTKKKYIEILRKNNKNFKFDKPYYSFVPKKGFMVIVMDAVIDDAITANGQVPQEELKWLDEQLTGAQKQGQIPLIFLHHPLHEPFPSFHHRIKNTEEFKAALTKYDMPVAVFSGHYHTTKIYKEGKILYVSTPALISYPCAFRIVSVSNKKDKVEFTFTFKETGLKDVQKKAKIMTFSSGIYRGEDSDRQGTVVLDK